MQTIPMIARTAASVHSTIPMGRVRVRSEGWSTGDLGFLAVSQHRWVGCQGSADVDAGSCGGVIFVFADDFADDGCGVALAEDEVAQQVGERVAFGPFEV